jgi:hypothetical protein
MVFGKCTVDMKVSTSEEYDQIVVKYVMMIQDSQGVEASPPDVFALNL